MSGMVEDEGTFFVSAAFGQNPITAATYEPVGLAGFLQLSDVAGVSARYPLAAYPSPNQALARVYGDFRVTCGIMQDSENIAKALSATAKVYVYQFAEKTPYTDATSLASRLPPNNNITYGAFHSSDVPYWYDQMTANPTSAQLQLAQTMSRALANFAKNGDPNTPGAAAQWQAYSSAQRGVTNLTQSAVTPSFDAYGPHQCGYWYGQPPTTRL